MRTLFELCASGEDVFAEAVKDCELVADLVRAPRDLGSKGSQDLVA